MNGKTTSHKNIFKMLGNPVQNTDGHLHYNDDQGYNSNKNGNNISWKLIKKTIC